jgi:4-carboxymuconolactone decarboxylase
MATSAKYRRGLKTRREVLGDAHVERAEAGKTDFDADFQRFITEYAWGDLWQRGGLERRTRHLITIALLAALGREGELALHIRATANTGVTPDEVREALHQVAVYAGLPAANAAFAIAKRAYAEMEESPAPAPVAKQGTGARTAADRPARPGAKQRRRSR